MDKELIEKLREKYPVMRIEATEPNAKGWYDVTIAHKKAPAAIAWKFSQGPTLTGVSERVAEGHIQGLLEAFVEREAAIARATAIETRRAAARAARKAREG